MMAFDVVDVCESDVFGADGRLTLFRRLFDGLHIVIITRIICVLYY